MYHPRPKYNVSLFFEIAPSPSISTLHFCPFTFMWRRSFGTIRCTSLYSNIFFTILITFSIFFFNFFSILLDWGLWQRYCDGCDPTDLPLPSHFHHVIYSLYGTYLCLRYDVSTTVLFYRYLIVSLRVRSKTQSLFFSIIGNYYSSINIHFPSLPFHMDVTTLIQHDPMYLLYSNIFFTILITARRWYYRAQNRRPKWNQ